MRRGYLALLFSTLIAACAATIAIAADFGGNGGGGGMCIYLPRSPILDLGDVNQMEAEVEQRYTHALDVSIAESTISSRSPRFPWSNEAKVACGMAIGFFKGREVNEEMISKCDCFYNRMVHFLR